MLTLLADLSAVDAVLLAVSLFSTSLVPFFLLVDAEPVDFDPRPAVRRAIESGRLDPLLIAVGPALHDARHTARTAAERARRAPRDAAITAAALLALLIPTGDTR